MKMRREHQVPLSQQRQFTAPTVIVTPEHAKKALRRAKRRHCTAPDNGRLVTYANRHYQKLSLLIAVA